MNKTVEIQRKLIVFGIPLMFVMAVIFIAKIQLSEFNSTYLSFAITFDLLLSIPLVYFLLIRKTKIPKATTYFFLFTGIIIASMVLPPENQYFLNLAKKWMLPILEGALLILILSKLIRGILVFKKNKSSFDFFTTLKKSCNEVLPKGVVTVFATEIAVFYYGFINWKKHIPGKNEFTYHKNSGIMAVLIAAILLIGLETFVVHTLLERWSPEIAWIITFISIYTAIQLFGFLKSMTKRLISLENGKLNIRYGILCESSINLEDIHSVEITSKDISESDIKKLTPFGDLESHNVIIRLKTEYLMIRPYGFKKVFKELALFVDEKEEFKKRIENAL